jgi:hypothetical protein
MADSVGVTCVGCGTDLLVMPTELYRAILDTLGSVEAEADFTLHAAPETPAIGARLAIADTERRYACPGCGRHERLPFSGS